MRNRIQPHRVMLFVLMFTVFAVTLFGVDIADYGFTIVSSFDEQGTTVYVVEDAAGNRFEFIGESVTQKQAQVILRVMKDFSELRYMELEGIRIVLSEDSIEALLVPSSFSYRGVDFTQYLPSGLRFYYKDYLEYDFRMFISRLFVRIREQYLDEASLAENMLEAVNDPVAYIQSHDPDYIIKKFISVEETISRLEKAHQEALEEISRLKGEIAAVGEEAGKSLEALKMSTVQVASQGLFSRIKEMDPAAVERAVALKTAEPGLSVDDAVAKLKEEDIKLSSNQVLIIFTVYFPAR